METIADKLVKLLTTDPTAYVVLLDAQKLLNPVEVLGDQGSNNNIYYSQTVIALCADGSVYYTTATTARAYDKYEDFCDNEVTDTD